VPSTKVLICIPTYKRTELLRVLLDSIGRQSFARLNPREFEISIAVFDNDPEESARQVVTEFKKIPADYQVVLEPGVVEVRNRALRLAKKTADILIFVDDDEEATEFWFESFMEAYRKSSCGILCGSLVPIYAEGCPRWIVEGGFFARELKPDLIELKSGNSGNTLIACDVLRRHQVEFDPKFSLTGGEDVLFFAQLRAKGEKIRFARYAQVKDHVPSSKARVSFLLKRAFRSGGTQLIVEKRILGWWKAVPLRMGRALFLLFEAGFVLLQAPFVRRSWLKCGIKLCLAFGVFAALLGIHVKPYAYGRERKRKLFSAFMRL